MMQPDKNIVLIGMPGAGKSTVGVVLAKMLNMDFLDTDLLIQKKHGETLQSLIDRLGPSRFIELENEALLTVAAENTVIATGGSAVYSQEGMRHLQEIGDVVYLKASLKELERRLTNFDERGIVVRDGASLSLEGLLEDRTPFYEKYADSTVEIDGLDITASAKRISSL